MLVSQEFGISVTYAIAPFSLFLLGTAFAPIYTPHLSERFGRRLIYLVAAFLSATFTIGSSQARSIEALCATRFFSGFFGGPIVVLIEGTYADIWPAQKTLLYYSNLAWASYLGAAAGPLVNGYLVQNLNWRWTQYTPLIMYLLVILFATGMPETYGRQIIRTIAHRANKPHNLPLALSGVTIRQMATLTIWHPLLMLVSDPITILFTLQVMLVFGTVFQWFIAVPTVLHLAYNFTPGQSGLAFISAIGAIPFAIATCSIIEALVYPTTLRRAGGDISKIDLEYRLLPAFLGGALQSAALFWIGWTAGVSPHAAVPIVGTWMFVWGNLVILICYVSYIFDAYPPQGTLSALTTGAVMRILFAAATPLLILEMITKLGGGVTYSIWGGISAGFIGITALLYIFGKSLRRTSCFSQPVDFS